MTARVPRIGADFLAAIPRLETVAAMVRYQNKNFDGSGYPYDKKSAEEIPLGARLLRVLIDLVLAETQGAARLQAVERMIHQSGKYDPRLLAMIAEGFGCKSTDANPAKERDVALRDLPAGAVLATNLMNTEGMLIATAGTVVSPALLEKLRNFSQLCGLAEPISIYG